MPIVQCQRPCQRVCPSIPLAHMSAIRFWIRCTLKYLMSLRILIYCDLHCIDYNMTSVAISIHSDANLWYVTTVTTATPIPHPPVSPPHYIWRGETPRSLVIPLNPQYGPVVFWRGSIIGTKMECIGRTSKAIGTVPAVLATGCRGKRAAARWQRTGWIVPVQRTINTMPPALSSAQSSTTCYISKTRNSCL